jgi:FMN phosphatase YigB (HAD superfamily)
VRMGTPHTVYAGILDQFGYSVPPEHVRDVARQAREKSLALPGGAQPDHTIDSDLERTRRETMVQHLLNDLGVREHFDECHRAIIQSWLTPDIFPAFDESLSVLRDLKRVGYIVAAVSNWESRLAELCASHGFAPYMDYILSSEAEGHVKPGTRLFELALERAGVRPEQTVHVGDRLHEDALTAQAVGITGVLLVRDGEPPPDYQPTIRNLGELIPLLSTQ